MAVVDTNSGWQPLGFGGLGLYRYAYANPVSYIDPDGRNRKVASRVLEGMKKDGRDPFNERDKQWERKVFFDGMAAAAGSTAGAVPSSLPGRIGASSVFGEIVGSIADSLGLDPDWGQAP